MAIDKRGQFMRPLPKAMILILATLMLGGCGGGELSDSGDTSVEQATKKMALAPELQSIYETNCKVCHGNAGTGAPMTGNSADWAERKSKGIDAMVTNAINGYQGMPAMGSCFACNDEELRALTQYMVGGASE